jgi:hypothetical protein
MHRLGNLPPVAHFGSPVSNGFAPCTLTMHNVNKMHNARRRKFAAKSLGQKTYVQIAPQTFFRRYACIVAAARLATAK